jgi:nicotinamide riboside kinase
VTAAPDPTAVRVAWREDARESAFVRAFGLAWGGEVTLRVDAPLVAQVGTPGVSIPVDLSGLSPWPKRDLEANETRRIVLLGPESTGKSWLSHDLARTFQIPFVPEYLRTWIDHKGLPVTLRDVHAVARGQIASEFATRSLNPPALVCDTDLWMNVVYARRYFGTCPEWIEIAAHAQPPALTLVLAPDVEWTPDPQRDLPDEAARWEVFESICSVLREASRPFTVVRGSWERRRSAAEEHVRALRL